MAWLVRGDDVLATVEVATTHTARRRGLRGRAVGDGAFVLRPCRHVHTFGMRDAIDVAFCARDGAVLRTVTLAPSRLSPFVAGTRFVVEAEAGAFERWRLVVGDVVEVRS